MYKKVQSSFIIFVLILAIFSLAGCTGQKAGKTTITAAAAADKEIKAKLEMGGVLIPTQTVDISSKLSGQITKLGFKVGDKVKAGDILMQLDTEALSGQLMQAQASLQSAQASAQAANNQVSLLKISLAAAQKNYDRTKVLFDSGAVSQTQLEDARDKLDTAQKQFENASGPARGQAQAAIGVAQANVKNFELQIKNATIKSPINGTITSQNVNVGQNVSAGLAVISIVDTAGLKMKSTVSQDMLPFLSVGQQIAVKIDSYPNSKFQGSISCIGPIAVSTGEVFPVEIAINNSSNLMAGLSAHAIINIKARGTVVPTAAIIHQKGNTYVYLIKNNTAIKRSVQMGLSNNQEALILKGLKIGDKVAVSSLSSLSNKAAVIVNK
ncbi:MAG TPA: efflux RND transporter periplasmic adaptor subunit [Syntrophomonadaceae bacterium]|nr:efflux RND transporter periplasmic adaptor subunit [Syntrophomonadaceae bacterium]